MELHLIVITKIWLHITKMRYQVLEQMVEVMIRLGSKLILIREEQSLCNSGYRLIM